VFEHILRPFIPQTIRRVIGMQRKIEKQEKENISVSRYIKKRNTNKNNTK
jgi:hypothetical protein